MHVRRAEYSDASSSQVVNTSLPRRDFVLLPLIFVGTILLLLLGGEVTARALYPQSDDAEPCEIHTAEGYRYKPFCTSRTKVWEGPWVTQKFNACGYPSAQDCGPRPAGSERVVIMGSSTSRGALVAYDDTFAARAARELSQRCGGNVDFQNLGSEPPDVDRIDRRIPEALALHPSAIVIVIGPFDLAHLTDPPPDADAPKPAARLDLHTVVGMLRESRLFMLMQAALYRDPEFQIRSFLLSTEAAGYVRAPLDAAWQRHVSDLGQMLSRVTAQTGPAHVPVLLVYVPERAQAALATGRFPVPNGVDPLAIGQALGHAAANAGVAFRDATPAFASAPDFSALYYLTDGHPRGAGHAAIAQQVEGGLLADPAFAACRKGATS